MHFVEEDLVVNLVVERWLREHQHRDYLFAEVSLVNVEFVFPYLHRRVEMEASSEGAFDHPASSEEAYRLALVAWLVLVAYRLALVAFHLLAAFHLLVVERFVAPLAFDK
tara:strand:- start:29 stop:358 length:330 start_codon:yes stop_codon:yes gene_type:complete